MFGKYNGISVSKNMIVIIIQLFNEIMLQTDQTDVNV